MCIHLYDGKFKFNKRILDLIIALSGYKKNLDLISKSIFQQINLSNISSFYYA